VQVNILLSILAIPILIYVGVRLFLLTPVFGAKSEGESLEKIKLSPQFIKGRFRNFGAKRADMTFSKMPQLIQESNKRKINRKPSHLVTWLKREREDFEQHHNDQLRATWFGHSAILFEMEGLRFAIDPMLGQAASPIPLAVRRFHKSVPLKAQDFPELDAVIYTHDHYDHLDYGTVKKLKNKVKHWYTPLGVAAHLKRWGVKPDNITELDWWEETTLGHLTLTSTPNQHFSGRTFQGRDRTLWCSWVINGKHNKIFFNGDSGYYDGFRIIGEKHGPFDLCFMECGQYHHLWKENHMTPEESVQAFTELGGKKIIPIHWGAFTLAPHSWTDPIERMAHACSQLQLDLITPKIGETVILHKHEPKEKWWIADTTKN